MWFLTAVGLIVDDAIVMMENINRHINDGLSPFDAAMKGSKEIGFAIIVITITLVAVFIPIGLNQGLTGQLFWQFAFTLVVAVLLSGFIAITLSPMMCAYILIPKTKEKGFAKIINIILDKTIHIYAKILTNVLNNIRFWSIFFFVMIFAGIGLYLSLPEELAPVADQGNITIPFNASSNASFKFMQDHAIDLQKALQDTPGAKNIIINLGMPNTYQGNANIVLKPQSDRSQTQSQIEASLQEKVSKIPGITANIAPPPPLGIAGQGGFSIELILMSSNSYLYLNTISKKLMQAFSKYPGFTGIQTNIKWDNMLYRVIIDRKLAADLGVNISDITNTVSAMTGNYLAGYYNYNNYPYDILLAADPKFSTSISNLESIYVKSSSNEMVPISSLIKVKRLTTPTVLSHFNGMQSLHIMTNLKSGYSIGDAVKFINKICKKDLPTDVTYTYFGQTKSFLESSNNMLYNFILAIIFIYLFLAAQFGSFKQPFIILTSVPLAIVGALATLYLTNSTLNVFSQIGIITLIGLIIKQGILITEFANQLKTTGMETIDAIIEASRLRFTPIIMTTAAMIFGAIPLVIHSGAGSEYNSQVGLVIIGGLIFGTITTLLIVPVFYMIISKDK